MTILVKKFSPKTLSKISSMEDFRDMPKDFSSCNNFDSDHFEFL